MAFYHVEIEADGLTLSDAKGFVANRYVIAASAAEAEQRAIQMTLHCWTHGRWKDASTSVPNIVATDSAQIGLWHFLRCFRQNKVHAFYEEE